MSIALPESPRTVRSFVIRAGRVTDAQQRALAEHWPRYGVNTPTEPLDLDALFGRCAHCTLEIGFGNGDHLAARAKAEPERDFLGVEVHRAGIGHLLHTAAAAGLTNLRIINRDAVEVLTDQIAPAALDEIQILFPDPWPKKRHHKRRLIQPGFASLDEPTARRRPTHGGDRLGPVCNTHIRGARSVCTAGGDCRCGDGSRPDPIRATWFTVGTRGHGLRVPACVTQRNTNHIHQENLEITLELVPLLGATSTPRHHHERTATGRRRLVPHQRRRIC